MEIIAAFVPVVLALAILGGVFFYMGAQRKKFAASFDGDPEFEVVPKSFNSAIRTKRAPIVTVAAAGGGKNNPRRWDVAAFAPRMGRRTSLHLSREGVAGKLRELVGFKDVRTGDTAFDDQFTVRGAEPDAIRGVLANDDVRAAVRAMFDVPGWSFQIRGEQGVVAARFPRAALDPARAREVARRVQTLLVVLEQHADDPTMRESIASAVGGSATGAPVGVPIGGR